MSTFVLKRKTFSEDKKGMSTGKKLALGTAGTLATAGLAFAGAKTGKLGAGLQKSANAAWGNVGAHLSKAGAKGIGGNMMKSGAEGVEKAQVDIAKKKLAGKSNYAIQSAGGSESIANKSGQNVRRIYEGKWNNLAQ